MYVAMSNGQADSITALYDGFHKLNHIFKYTNKTSWPMKWCYWCMIRLRMQVIRQWSTCSAYNILIFRLGVQMEDLWSTFHLYEPDRSWWDTSTIACRYHADQRTVNWCSQRFNNAYYNLGALCAWPLCVNTCQIIYSRGVRCLSRWRLAVQLPHEQKRALKSANFFRLGDTLARLRQFSGEAIRFHDWPPCIVSCSLTTELQLSWIRPTKVLTLNGQERLLDHPRNYGMVNQLDLRTARFDSLLS